MLVDKVSADFNEYRSNRSQDNSHAVPSERLAEIGFFLFESLDVLLSLFPQDDSESILTRFQTKVNEWICWQLSSEAMPRKKANVLAAIPRLYQKYHTLFLEHHGCWCITPGILCELLKKELNDAMIDQQTIINLLRENGALLMDKSKSATKKVGGHRLLHIIPQKL